MIAKRAYKAAHSYNSVTFGIDWRATVVQVATVLITKRPDYLANLEIKVGA